MAYNPYQSYQSNDNSGLSHAEQIAQLFDRASTHMQSAASAIESNDIERRYCETEGAMNIIEGLGQSLSRDTDEQREMAKHLEVYYSSMIVMIGDVNIKNDLNMCRSAARSFASMADCWREAGKNLESQVNGPAPQPISQESFNVQA